MRKLFCDNPDCGRRIFTERLPGVVAVALGGPLAPGSAGNSLGGDPEVELARAFSAMVRYQQAERLNSWLAAAKDTALSGSPMALSAISRRSGQRCRCRGAPAPVEIAAP